MHKARRTLLPSLQREPSCAEVAAAVGLHPQEVRELQAAFRRPGSLVQAAGDSGCGGQVEVQAEDVVDADCAVRPQTLFGVGFMMWVCEYFW